ncbi:ABC transporter substrate-binding protein [Mesorhizobium sp. 113-3-9]|uniref:ABC transporter substrate-binding protein n=1 Tax=Mesorhizobium sp. 113-3-9 TaxID=2744517 RepID=UPI001928209D|nr:ABC transporter substrate-binding protein [Mesorhizobium sp. 113-3-9]
MFDRMTCLQAVSVLAVMTAFGCATDALAQGFDTSGIKVDPSLAARLPDKIKDAGVIVIGSDTSYAPWEYLSEKDGQTPEGIDVDIADAIGNRLGVKIDFQTSAFDAILPALGTKFDLGVSALSITKERMNAVNFVSYTQTGNLWGIRAGNPTNFDPANLCGTKIAIMSGTSHEKEVEQESQRCVSSGKKEIELIPFKVQTEALTRVAAGGADATFSGPATIGYAAKSSNGQLETMEATPAMSEVGYNGIAVAKSDDKLTGLVADTINSLIEDGTYKAILDAWGLGSAIVDKAMVNPQVED